MTEVHISTQCCLVRSTVIPPIQPRFTDIEDEETAHAAAEETKSLEEPNAVEETPVKAKEGEPVLPPTPPKSD